LGLFFEPQKGELQYVVIVDGTTLNTADSNSDPSSVKFEVTSPAHGLGHLIFVDSFISAKSFTQKDINNGRIGYVVHYKDFHPAIVPTGSFTFKISDMWGNTRSVCGNLRGKIYPSPIAVPVFYSIGITQTRRLILVKVRRSCLS